ncbi:MAG: large repetitive protein [Frankiales bacterium]|jgi:hypothetical protein|nr:large repetitive protein [Frankiales bacterium]
MGRHRPRKPSRRLLWSLPLTVLASVTTLGALSLAVAPAASAADATANPQTQQAPLARPVGLQITNPVTGARVSGAGYHLCGHGAGPQGAVCPAGTTDLGGSRSNASGVITFASKVPGGQYAVVSAHSPGGYLADAAVHSFAVPDVTSKAQASATFWLLLNLQPKPVKAPKPPAAPKAPKLKTDRVTTLQNTSTHINVLANDDGAGGALQVASVGTPQHGSVTTAPDGTVTYKPAVGFVGKDSFTYSARTGAGAAVTGGLVKVHVSNVGPTARDVTLKTKVNTPVGFDPLKYATAPAGDTVRLWAITQPQHGQTVVSGKQVLYIPDAGFTGTDSFTYTVTDGQGACDTAKVTVTIPKTEVLGRPPVTAQPPTLPVTGPRNIDSALTVGLALLGLGIVVMAGSTCVGRRKVDGQTA